CRGGRRGPGGRSRPGLRPARPPPASRRPPHDVRSSLPPDGGGGRHRAAGGGPRAVGQHRALDGAAPPLRSPPRQPAAGSAHLRARGQALMAIFSSSTPAREGGAPEPQRRRGEPTAVSIIGKDMTITGDLETEGVIKVEGAVRGTIRAGTQVLVSPGATRSEE